MSKAYIFNDETQINSYGFRVKTGGIDLTSRFQRNPICLNNHQNDTKNVLGRWIDIEKKQGLLMGTPQFDTEDNEGKEVVRKINNGTIVSVSMGLFFDPNDIIKDEQGLCLTKCELYEVSFVAVPSNSKSIVLYDKNDGKEYTPKEVQQITLSIKNKPNQMNLITKHLQLAEGATESDVVSAIKSLELKFSSQNAQLKAEYTEMKSKYDALIEKQTVALKAKYDAEIERAIKDGRIDLEGKAPIDKMVLTAGYESGLALLNALPKHENIASKLNISSEPNFDKMTWEQLDKGNHLAKLKAENPKYYQQRFQEQYGKNKY